MEGLSVTTKSSLPRDLSERISSLGHLNTLNQSDSALAYEREASFSMGYFFNSYSYIACSSGNDYV